MAIADLLVREDRPGVERKLRVGLCLDADQIGGWRKIVVQRVRDDPSVEIALIIDGAQSQVSRHSLFTRATRALWRLIDGVEARLSRGLMHRVLASVNGFAPERLDQRPVHPPELDRPRVRMDGLDAIRAADLDIVLDLCEHITRGAHAGAARLGTWSLRTTCGRNDAVSPLGFWEFYRDQAISEVRVVSLRPDAREEEILAAAHYCTYRWSWSLNEVLLGLKASWLLLDTMHRVRDGTSLSKAQDQGGRSPTGAGEYYRERGLLEAPALLAKCTTRIIAKMAHQSLFEDHWRVLLMEASPLGAISAGPIVVKPPPDRYWADPFAMRRNGKCYIFFEEYVYATRRGVISYIELGGLDDAKRLTNPVSRCVIDEPFHLSYPFLFDYHGDVFMIPESSANRTIDIWQATDFPIGWQKHKTLFEGIGATDTSLLEWNGKWWLFTNIDRNGMNDHRNELHIFYADDPLDGPWRAHALNPVFIDARKARMAGGFLKGSDGRPIRCGQVQSKRYGEAVAYNVVSELSPTRYAETPLIGFNPVPITPGARTHHVAYRDGLLVADECLITNKLARRFSRN